MASVTAVGYISLLPISMLSIIPINVPVSVLNSLVAFAIGGLLGDVFLHLLPHAFSPHDHHGHADEHRGHAHTHEHGEHEHGHSDHGHEHHDDEHTRNMRIGLSVLGGFMLFFLLEKIMRALGRVHSHEEDTEKKTPTPTGSLQLAAYLNLLADAMHNFTDGLAIAAAFHTSRALGITTTIACFFHEIPHEVGDFVILIRSGFSRQQAILMQVVTAFGAMAGVLVGNYLGSLDASVSQVILPATAGGFVYIATVGVVPELLENTKPSKWLGVISEVAMMSLGVALMAWIALNE
jgi:zinc transporter 7